VQTTGQTTGQPNVQPNVQTTGQTTGQSPSQVTLQTGDIPIKPGGPMQISCNDGSKVFCPSGTQYCYNNSAFYCHGSINETTKTHPLQEQCKISVPCDESINKSPTNNKPVVTTTNKDDKCSMSNNCVEGALKKEINNMEATITQINNRIYALSDTLCHINPSNPQCTGYKNISPNCNFNNKTI
jgi:hypothetical protein